jgi:hypothetical protein
MKFLVVRTQDNGSREAANGGGIISSRSKFAIAMAESSFRMCCTRRERRVLDGALGHELKRSTLSMRHNVSLHDVLVGLWFWKRIRSLVHVILRYLPQRLHRRITCLHGVTLASANQSKDWTREFGEIMVQDW